MQNQVYGWIWLAFFLCCCAVPALGKQDAKKAPVQANAKAAEPELILVAGATGSIGKFVVQDLLKRGHRVRGLTRRPEAAAEKLPEVDWVGGDLREFDTLVPVVEGVDRIVFAAGSKSWSDPTNTPELVDYGGVAKLADLGKRFGVKRMVVISSVGTENEIKGTSDHLKNVLKWKAKAEVHVRESGVPYTILRPLGMWNQPGGQMGVAIMQGDTVRASVTISREDLAAVSAECLFNPDAKNKSFELFNAATWAVDTWKKDLPKLLTDEERFAVR